MCYDWWWWLKGKGCYKSICVVTLTGVCSVKYIYHYFRSSFEWNYTPYDVPDMHAKPGTPCNNYNGYCDVFQRCREVCLYFCLIKVLLSILVPFARASKCAFFFWNSLKILWYLITKNRKIKSLQVTFV